MTELDPAGVAPGRVYTKPELLRYLEHGRLKCQARIGAVAEVHEDEMVDFGWIKTTLLESLLYNMRHVQHHAGQLNLVLRQQTQSAPRWVARTRR